MLLNLTYTLPPFFALGYDIQRNAMQGTGFDPSTGLTMRSESTVQRLIRGFFSGGIVQVAKNIWHLLYFLASLSMCGLGMYAAIVGKSFVFAVVLHLLTFRYRYDRCIQSPSAKLLLLPITS